MAENLTQPTDADVGAFVDRAEPAGRREDARVLLDLIGRVTGAEPVLWGPSIIGYGRYRYRYGTGREGDWPILGFSPRKASMTLYGLQHPESVALLDRLGPHKRGVDCVYVGRLNKIDLDVLEQLVARSWERGTGE